MSDINHPFDDPVQNEKNEPRADGEESFDDSSAVSWLPEPKPVVRIVKRLIDVVGSLCALVVFLPLFLFIFVAVKVTSSGPAFFSQTRVGYHGRPFRFLKFRTMFVNSDVQSLKKYVASVISEANRPGKAGVYKISNDPRVTPVGRFLRRTSLDELPQFINVLMGDMSLVGPRPPIAYEVEAYDEWHKLRLSCKPGITGLWQVQTGKALTFDEMVRLDLAYIKNVSILEDLRILVVTPRAVFSPYV